MRLRTSLLALPLAAGLLAAVPLAEARTDFSISIGPPPPRYEVVPAPRPGWVWAPGYWNWNGRRHVWQRGHYVRERPGYRWQSDRWHRDGDRWRFERGHWGR